MKTITTVEEVADNCLIKFGASWCAPCRVVKPVLEKVEAATGATILDVDIDESPDLTEAFGIRSVPTVVAIKNASVIDTIVGAKPEAVYLELVNKLK